MLCVIKVSENLLSGGIVQQEWLVCDMGTDWLPGVDERYTGRSDALYEHTDTSMPLSLYTQVAAWSRSIGQKLVHRDCSEVYANHGQEFIGYLVSLIDTKPQAKKPVT